MRVHIFLQNWNLSYIINFYKGKANALEQRNHKLPIALANSESDRTSLDGIMKKQVDKY